MWSLLVIGGGGLCVGKLQLLTHVSEQHKVNYCVPTGKMGGGGELRVGGNRPVALATGNEHNPCHVRLGMKLALAYLVPFLRVRVCARCVCGWVCMCAREREIYDCQYVRS